MLKTKRISAEHSSITRIVGFMYFLLGKIERFPKALKKASFRLRMQKL